MNHSQVTGGFLGGKIWQSTALVRNRLGETAKDRRFALDIPTKYLWRLVNILKNMAVIEYDVKYSYMSRRVMYL